MIEGVEELRAALQANPIGEVPVLLRGDVRVVEARCAQPRDKARSVAEAVDAGGHLLKGEGVEVPVDVSVLDVEAADDVWTDVGAVEIGSAATRDAEREAGLEGGDAGDLPAADDGIDTAVEVAAELAAATDGELVDVVDDERVRGVAAIDGLLGGEIVVVLRSLIAGVRPVVSAGDVVEELGVGVRDEDVEAGVEAVVVVRLEGVIDGEADGGLRLGDTAVLREGREQMTAGDGGLIEAAARGLDDAIEGIRYLIVEGGAERVEGRVELAVVEGAEEQLGAVIADEGGGEDVVAGKGVLHAERVVLHVGRAAITGSGGGGLADILQGTEGGSLWNEEAGGKGIAERGAECDAVVDGAGVGC